MRFENTHTYNFEGALRGMRNPMNSWNKSDSYFGLTDIYMEDSLTDVCDAWIDNENVGRRERGLEEYSHDMENYNEYYDIFEKYEGWLVDQGILNSSDYGGDVYEVAFIGPNDLDLAQRLILAGDEHAKFMRQIFVSIDISAPLYWWKEFDTYKVGTVANSTSTMHKLSSIPITKEMFEFDDNADDLVVSQGKSINGEWEYVFSDYIEDIIDMCENLRLKFKETGDAAYWRALVQILPNAYVQTRTVTMSYANLRNIYFQRKSHKLKEWHDFCDWIKTLPYSGELITIGE